jgi:hypothetical protein
MPREWCRANERGGVWMRDAATGFRPCRTRDARRNRDRMASLMVTYQHRLGWGKPFYYTESACVENVKPEELICHPLWK